MDSIPQALAPTPEAATNVTSESPAQPQAEQPTPDANTTHIYDMSGKEPVLGTMNHDEVQDAVRSGKFSLPKGEIKVLNPDGEYGTMDAAEAPEAFNNGFTYATPAMIHEEENKLKYGTTGQMAVGLAESAGRGLLGPVAPLAEKALGVPTEDIRGREEAIGPIASGVAEAVGFGGGMFLGTGEARALTMAGESVLKAAEAAGVGSKIAQGALRMGSEMAVMQAGDEASKYILDVPNSVGGAVTNIGLSGMLGMITGGTFAGLGKATSALAEKVGLQEALDRAKIRLTGADPAEALRSELGSALGTVSEISDETFGVSGLKSTSMRAALPEATAENIAKVDTRLNEINNKVEDALSKAESNPHLRSNVEKIRYDLGKFQEVYTNPKADMMAKRDALDMFKSDLQDMSKWGNRNGDTKLSSFSKGLAYDIRLELEDPKIWGGAGTIQKDLNKAYSEFFPTLKDMKSKFMAIIDGKEVISPEKVATYLRQGDKTTTESSRKQIMGNFIEKFDKLQKTVDGIYTKAGIENPHTVMGLGGLRESLNKQSPWVKAIDAYFDKNISAVGGFGIGSALGGSAGHMTGLPGAGWAGSWLGGKMGEHVLPGIIQPLMEKAVNTAGYQEAIKFGTAALKGQSTIEKGVSSIIKGTTFTNLKNIMPPDDKRLDKLDKQITEFKKDPVKAVSNGNPLEHYMPEHSAELAKLSGNAVQYLDGLKPHKEPTSMLDSKHEPTKAEMAPYWRALSIAEAPLSILNHIKDGTLLPQDIATLHTVSPATYSQISAALLKEAGDMAHNETAIPYVTRQAMSLFIGHPVDSTMTPAGIMAAQAGQKSQQPPPQMPQQGKGGGKSMKSLGKSNSSYLTPNQSAEKDRSDRE